MSNAYSHGICSPATGSSIMIIADVSTTAPPCSAAHDGSADQDNGHLKRQPPRINLSMNTRLSQLGKLESLATVQELGKKYEDKYLS